MSCCQNPPFGRYYASLLADSQLFGRYVARGLPMPLPPLMREMTSALHVEMKLWRPTAPLPKRFIPNNVQVNAWRAMQQMGIRNLFNAPAEAHLWAHIHDTYGHSIRAYARSQCILLEFDKWILDAILFLRLHGIGWPAAIGQNLAKKPTALATVGLAQKLLNIYVKYLFCWGWAGRFLVSPIPGAFTPAGPSNSSPLYSLLHSTCAPHAPIDRILIKRLQQLSLGKHMIKIGLLHPHDQKLHEAAGGFWPWSKLDCLRTYYGFQLILRRLAMHTWPPGCACNCFGPAHGPIPMTKRCGDEFDIWFPNQVENGGPDWIRSALEIPEEVFADTIDQIAGR
jgi:hypothetical protein